MANQSVLTHVNGGVATVLLNRPEALNAMHQALRSELVAALQALKSDASVRAVVLSGKGRAFSAGLDFNELQGAAALVAANGIVGQQLLDEIAAFDRPIIAAVNGFAMTGGLELALLCDVIIASEDAVFADTHAKLGIVPGWGVTQRLPRAIGIYRAKEMSLTGRKVDAQLAYDWGLVNRVTARDQLIAEAQAMAEQMAQADHSAQSTIRELMDLGWEAPIESGLEQEQQASLVAFQRFAKAQQSSS
ncbi:putative enoyl-CoA hydratase echA8 [Sinobacterium norvegicum]|uniref:Enoyl-CoA hydratase echA8 n=1 Tax=Sinobacterium norvegicum TaxID=1641715 RepID=A0ABM9AK07_9GAMM|nr:enoyl-CoA hydratase [Sinobacterium norvegicum]CAH0993089.1 putative enoyl-CoA hydratase echA8 [Sinobacterium norvegicum]